MSAASNKIFNVNNWCISDQKIPAYVLEEHQIFILDASLKKCDFHFQWLMTQSSLLIRQFKEGDEEALVSLWNMCKLTVPWNNPYKDIARKLKVQSELFLIGYLEDKLIASIMAGYDGHRGWINYFAVHPDFQSRGYGKQLMVSVENGLR